MNVIGQHAPGIDPQAKVVRDARQSRQEVVTIVGVAEDVAPLDTTSDDVVHCL